MSEWKNICAVNDIPVLGSRRVQRAQGPQVALFRSSDDAVFALLDRCPHKGGPLSQGIVFGNKVACPLHNWTIALDSGQAQAPDEGCTAKFSVRVEAGQVLLNQFELETVGIEFEPIKAGPCTRSC
ncbi:nitrite reductase small subunit NirD [Roseateles oligotrophus]|uniref:Nitrite reductase small subunit NirD n=1 Tax=Roseateles oligotrophus TaxID=1769250 RepID=A0ABT2YID0_9BURK|nr:nitrite reductase small subunit NirD [Roseateles oligotrophus]MCV2369763.1 nitrite reductase small subunit NirD [Roseateles oligotrophus]